MSDTKEIEIKLVPLALVIALVFTLLSKLGIVQWPAWLILLPSGIVLIIGILVVIEQLWRKRRTAPKD